MGAVLPPYNCGLVTCCVVGYFVHPHAIIHGWGRSDQLWPTWLVYTSNTSAQTQGHVQGVQQASWAWVASCQFSKFSSTIITCYWENMENFRPTRCHVGELFNKGRSKASICRELGFRPLPWTEESTSPDLCPRHDWRKRSGRPKKLTPALNSKIKKMARPDFFYATSCTAWKIMHWTSAGKTVARIWSSEKNPLFWRPVAAKLRSSA
jgi:hypothetical protein